MTEDDIQTRLAEIVEQAEADAEQAFALRHDLYRDVVRIAAQAEDDQDAVHALLLAQAAIAAEEIAIRL